MHRLWLLPQAVLELCCKHKERLQIHTGGVAGKAARMRCSRCTQRGSMQLLLRMSGWSALRLIVRIRDTAESSMRAADGSNLASSAPKSTDSLQLLLGIGRSSSAGKNALLLQDRKKKL